jgi:iron complex outermembrane receptor protein
MLRKTHLSLAVSAALGITATPAVLAQGDVALEEVVVTGSRIQKTNLVSASPVVQVDAEELRFQGATRVEDMLRGLPQLYSFNNSGLPNGATGTATVNLRNLGDERTLVLINGRRMPAGSPIDDGIGSDINQIPGALIKNVEILTGGASATYGSDAVAGVVNFIMMDDFEGVKLDYQFSQYNHDNDNGGVQDFITEAGFPTPSGSTSDGDTYDISLIIGGNLEGGRGNVTAYVTYRDIEAVKQSARDYSACAMNEVADGCFGSGTIPDGRVTDFGIGPGFDFKVAGDQFVPRDGTTYNYGPENHFQRPDERWTFGAFAHYDVNEHVEAYTELMFMDDRSNAQIAPSGAFFVTNTIPCGNPLLSDQQFEQLCGQFGLTEDDTQFAYLGRRNVEGGPRNDDLRHTSFRIVTGGRGDINDTWRYDTYLQYSEVSMEETYFNHLSTTRIIRALDAVEDPNGGEPVCRSVVDGSDPSCVPWDIFTTGNVTQEMQDYLKLPLFSRGTTQQAVFSAYVAGNLGNYGVKLPSAESGIDVVFGLEYRDEDLEYSPDQGYITGDGAGQGGAQKAVDGGYDVSEFFTEVSVPLVEGAAWAEELTLDAGYRFSDYSTDHETDTYGVRVGWAINQQVKLRASYQRAVRAANVRELFLPQGLALFTMTADPCAGPSPARSAADCARSGVTADQYGNVPDSPAGQYNFLQGGNTELEPEEADTYSAGIVWSPDFADGLSVSVDYYDIEIELGIDKLGQEFTLNQCLDGNDSQCANVKRGRSGDLWIGSTVGVSGHIVALNDNLAIERVKGWDILVDYDVEIGKWGSLGFHNNMAIIDTWDQQELVGAPTVDCNGGWGATCGSPTVEVQNNLRTIWTTPWNVTASLMWRYIDEVEDLNGNLDLDDVHYFDLSGIWDVTDWASLRAGVNNMFDEEPPIAGAGASSEIQGAGNIFPGGYDALGRYWYLGVSVGF